MPKYTPEQIYAAARALLPELDEAARRQAGSLLAQAERGQATDLELLDLLTQQESVRQRLRALLKSSEGERLLRSTRRFPAFWAPPRPDIRLPGGRVRLPLRHRRSGRTTAALPEARSKACNRTTAIAVVLQEDAMLTSFWETAAKTFPKWLERLFGPAFLFWAGGLTLWFGRAICRPAGTN